MQRGIEVIGYQLVLIVRLGVINFQIKVDRIYEYIGCFTLLDFGVIFYVVIVEYFTFRYRIFF